MKSIADTYLLICFRLIVLLLLITACTPALQAQDTETLYLSGTSPADAVAWEFMVSKGRRAGEWTTIPVPAHWEQHGFGAYNYGHDWDNGRRPVADEVGHYRYRFEVPQHWLGNHVEIVFDGAMTDTEVRVNGSRLSFTFPPASVTKIEVDLS